MYDAEAVLESIDDNTVWVLLIAGAALIGMAVWLIEAFRNARRDRTFALPMFCTMYWLVHDAHYSAHFDDWFNDYDHWFPELFWVALTCTATFEAVCAWLIVRYGRAEIAPTFDDRLWPVAVGATVVASLIAWVMVKDVVDDPLYIVTNGLAVLSFAIFGLARIIRNGDTRGQSVLMWQGFTVCAVGWFTVTATCFGDSFHDWRWILVGTVSVLGGITGMILTRRMQAPRSVSSTGPVPVATAPEPTS